MAGAYISYDVLEYPQRFLTFFVRNDKAVDSLLPKHLVDVLLTNPVISARIRSGVCSVKVIIYIRVSFIQ